MLSHLRVKASELRDRFAQFGYVRIPCLLARHELLALQADLRRLEHVGRRRDFAMACMGDSPRHMTTVGGHLINRESSLIPQLYADRALVELLCDISGLGLIPVPDPVERHVVNILHQEGDTHGWHVDDYPVALVVFAEAPPAPQDGGLLEYMAHAGDPTALATACPRQAYHRAGETYLLRSDTTAHRVTPLRRSGVRRVVLNLAYTTPQQRTVMTPSAALLYG